MPSSLFQSQDCLGFFKHWKSLCVGDAILPSQRDFLDRAEPRYAPFIHISEANQRGEMIVRLMGTGIVERWGRDKTGEAMGAGQPKGIQEAMYSNTRNVISRPCGLRSEIELAASSGSEMIIEAITLPLGVDPGRPGRLVAYSAVMRKLEHGEHSEHYKSLSNVNWIDIGAGVPDAPPQVIAI